MKPSSRFYKVLHGVHLQCPEYGGGLSKKKKKNFQYFSCRKKLSTLDSTIQCPKMFLKVHPRTRVYSLISQYIATELWLEKGAFMSTLVVSWWQNGREGRSAPRQQDHGGADAHAYFVKDDEFGLQSTKRGPLKRSSNGLWKSTTPMWRDSGIGTPRETEQERRNKGKRASISWSHWTFNEL